MARKYSKSQQKLRTEYNKQRKRIKQFVQRAEKRGYLFETDFIPPSISKVGNIKRKDIKNLEKLTPNEMYEQAEYFGELVSEPVSGKEGRTIENKNKAKKASITRNNIEEYIPQFSITEQLKRRINEMEFKSYRASVVYGEQLVKYKSAYVSIIEDNIMADEDKYVEYLMENESFIMTKINDIEIFYEETKNRSEDSQIILNDLMSELLTLLNMGTMPIFYD